MRCRKQRKTGRQQGELFDTSLPQDFLHMANREDVQKLGDVRTNRQHSALVLVEPRDVFHRQLKLRSQTRDDWPLIGLIVLR